MEFLTLTVCFVLLLELCLRLCPEAYETLTAGLAHVLSEFALFCRELLVKLSRYLSELLRKTGIGSLDLSLEDDIFAQGLRHRVEF